VRQQGWSYEDEEDGAPPQKRYGYRDTLGADKYGSQETAAGVFSNRRASAPRPVPRARNQGGGPPPPPKPLVLPEPIAAPAPTIVGAPKPIRWAPRDAVVPVSPAPLGAPPVVAEEMDDEPQPLAVHPLRTPAPEITTIRVRPTPVDDIEFEVAQPFRPPAPVAEPPPQPLVAGPRAPHVWSPPAGDRPSLSWLDEDD
jgi:hypothetical protein